jgi:hypothetical protein
LWVTDAEPGSGTPALGFGVTAFAMDGQRTDAGSTSAFLISSTRRLYHATFSPGGSLTSLTEVPVSRFGEPVSVALGSNQVLYVAVRIWGTPTESPRFSVLKLQ